MKRQNRKTKVTAVILSGGSGSRMKGYKHPKQFIRVLGQPIFIHSLKIYEKVKEVDEIILVINAKHRKKYEKDLKKQRFRKLTKIVPGGRYRQDSIKNALGVIDHNGVVIIHNAANPTTPAPLVKQCIRLAKRKKAVTAYVPAFHTIFLKNKEKIGKHIPRDLLGYTCEPQVYKIDTIKSAYRYRQRKSIKDVPIIELLQRMNCPVHLVAAPMSNFKVTVQSDLKVAEFILKNK